MFEALSGETSSAGMESLESWSQITRNNSTTTPSGISPHSWKSRTTTPSPPTHKPMGKLRSRTDPCLKSLRLDSKRQRVYGQKCCQVYYGHIGRQQEHLQGKHRFDQLIKAMQSSQRRLDSPATKWIIIIREGMTKLCIYNWIYQTKSGKKLSRDSHDTKTSWPSTVIPKSDIETSRLETSS